MWIHTLENYQNYASFRNAKLPCNNHLRDGFISTSLVMTGLPSDPDFNIPLRVYQHGCLCLAAQITTNCKICQKQ